ncbi:DUF1232 domain-containing protein [Patescibacteria group bacterium]|nr:DUF1232 domain-containing protein [Patescibacteria group bacterium]
MLKRMEAFWGSLKKSVVHFRDKEVPFGYKLLPILAFVYLIFPFDFVSDFIPFVGQVDDISLLTLSLLYFTKISESRRIKNAKN